MPNETEHDDELDTDLDGDGGQAGAEGNVDDDEWVPPTREAFEGMQEALRKARRDARAAKRGKPAASKDGDAADPAKVQADAESAAAAKYRPIVVKTAARAAFASAGLVLPDGKADAVMSRALRLLDLDDLEISDDGEVEGLDEQIQEIKSDFPEMFGAGQVRRPRRIDAGGRDGSGNGSKKSSAELIAAQLTG